MEKLLLRVGEAAEMASLGRSKAYEMVATGEWPSVTIGRAVRVPLDGLIDWIEEQKRSSEQARGLDRETA
ncbi:MAG: helix-turn-helix domain-containing protein [Longimicrobiales bacterium]